MQESLWLVLDLFFNNTSSGIAVLASEIAVSGELSAQFTIVDYLKMQMAAEVRPPDVDVFLHIITELKDILVSYDRGLFRGEGKERDEVCKAPSQILVVSVGHDQEFLL